MADFFGLGLEDRWNVIMKTQLSCHMIDVFASVVKMEFSVTCGAPGQLRLDSWMEKLEAFVLSHDSMLTQGTSHFNKILGFDKQTCGFLSVARD